MVLPKRGKDQNHQTTKMNMPKKTTLNTKKPITGTPSKPAHKLPGIQLELLDAKLHRLLVLHLL